MTDELPTPARAKTTRSFRLALDAVAAQWETMDEPLPVVPCPACGKPAMVKLQPDDWWAYHHRKKTCLIQRHVTSDKAVAFRIEPPTDDE